MESKNLFDAVMNLEKIKRRNTPQAIKERAAAKAAEFELAPAEIDSLVNDIMQDFNKAFCEDSKK